MKNLKKKIEMHIYQNCYEHPFQLPHQENGENTEGLHRTNGIPQMSRTEKLCGKLL
jgi:hypothetical protein